MTSKFYWVFKFLLHYIKLIILFECASLCVRMCVWMCMYVFLCVCVYMCECMSLYWMYVFMCVCALNTIFVGSVGCIVQPWIWV